MYLRVILWRNSFPFYDQDDVKEINELFYDAKASAKILQQQEEKFMK